MKQLNMKNMKISKKLMCGFGVTILASIILMALSIGTIRRVGGMTSELYSGPYVAATEAQSFVGDVYEMEALMNRTMLEENLGKYEAAMEEVSARADASLEKIKAIGGADDVLSQINSIRAEVGKSQDEILNLMRKGDWEKAGKKVTQEYAQGITRCAEIAETLSGEADASADHFNSWSESVVSKAIFILIGVFVLLLVASMLI